jgi:hypothetical protein
MMGFPASICNEGAGVCCALSTVSSLFYDGLFFCVCFYLLSSSVSSRYERGTYTHYMRASDASRFHLGRQIRSVNTCLLVLE